MKVVQRICDVCTSVQVGVVAISEGVRQGGPVKYDVCAEHLATIRGLLPEREEKVRKSRRGRPPKAKEVEDGAPNS